MTAECKNLFVYGTLKKAYGNHRLISGAVLLGEAVSQGQNYVMWGGGFPFVAETNHGYAVKGEVYEITSEQLRMCDQLEGHPDWYRRQIRAFEIKGLTVPAWIYLQPYDKSIIGNRMHRPMADSILEWNR